MQTKCLAPSSVKELLAALREMTPASKIIGGGTDLIIKMNAGLCCPDVLLPVGGVKELCEITQADSKLEIGAALTMSRIASHSLIREKLRALSDAAADVGSPQIRNNGTIGGNLVNASPAGDILPVLFLYQAQVVIASPDGLRTEPVEKIVTGPSRTCLHHNEAVVKIIVPVQEDVRYRSAFVKLGFRKAVTVSRIGLAASGYVEGNRIFTPCVMAGAISIKPLHVQKAEECLDGAVCDAHVQKEAGRHLSELILEVTPKKFDRDYKIEAARGVMEDVLNRLVGA